ncbi:glucosidase family protein [Sphingomonas nostoxanthinifaciens]|uniref:hypothetical protein n=1 Tax=Sphingomonas nostoxanthinifaciens TaxID=2872652 RepID=UPI001CC1F37A|nr:hypothetical protein [Sphingomonas nostoxanthinifaciens]UAK25913.1 hypothetical protein K8P63_07265 [Sphingomonas nostoxanthinifaciens]
MALLPRLGAFALAISLGAASVARVETDAIQREGLNLNSFVQSGPVAAHVVLRSGTNPRLIVAFPAGNSGVGLWFEPTATAAEWRIDQAPQPFTAKDDKGRPLHGVTFRAVVQTPRLAVKRAVLSSVRVLRDYQALGTAPSAIDTPMRGAGNRLSWTRDRLDGAPGYALSLTVKHGGLEGGTIMAGPDGMIALSFTALTGETPLTPVPAGALLEPGAAVDPKARRALTFLSYREKFLAGSWRFNTYFGRDTLMSVRLLMPALKPAAVETGLRSVLARLAPDGNVAHEEDIGEFAILDHRKAHDGASAAPVYDYKMIDSAYLLAPVAGAWLLDDPRGRARAAAFLAEHDGEAQLGSLLMRNLRFVIAHAQPFARDPQWRNLIALKAGMDAGEWRDSNDGLGGGRYPYDVNAVLVPAALEAAAALDRAGLLAPYASADDRAMLAALPAIVQQWQAHAPALFAVTKPSAEARPAIEHYADSLGVPAAPALASVAELPVRFHAIALDGEGKPVPILNSDEGFALLFARPAPAMLDRATEAAARPFPAGLMTGAGMLVANPVFAPPALQARFGPGAYHGTVIWSWQQALMAAGLARQIARTDLPAATCARLHAAQSALWHAIDATRSMQSSELWSWRHVDGRYQIAPFGASGADVDESNAAQLWSTVYLAVQHPTAHDGACGR